jgi:hypothetical protein
MLLVEFTYQFLALLAVGLLIFRLAHGPRARQTSELEDLASGSSVLVLVVGVILALLALAAFAYVLAATLTRFPVVVEVVFAGGVTGVAWPVTRSLWRRFSSPPHSSGGWALMYVACLVGALVAGSAWLVSPSWPVYDATFLLLAVTAARASSSISLKVALVAVALLIVYDAWVWSIAPASGLGMGDFVISGMIVGAFGRHGLTCWAAGGFALGLLAALLLPFTWFPALLTLLPAIMLCGGVGYLVQRGRNGGGGGQAVAALADRHVGALANLAEEDHGGVF